MISYTLAFLSFSFALSVSPKFPSYYEKLDADEAEAEAREESAHRENLGRRALTSASEGKFKQKTDKEKKIKMVVTPANKLTKKKTKLYPLDFLRSLFFPLPVAMYVCIVTLLRTP